MESIFHKAVKQKNPLICREITWKVWMQDYGQSPTQSQHSCYINYAVETNNIDYCNSLTATSQNSSDWSLRDSCTYKLAQKRKDPKLCKMLPLLRMKQAVNWLKVCIERIKKD
jgi:hypothetical protein